VFSDKESLPILATAELTKPSMEHTNESLGKPKNVGFGCTENLPVWTELGAFYLRQKCGRW